MLPLNSSNSLVNINENEEGVVKPKDIISHFYPDFLKNPELYTVPEKIIICYNPYQFYFIKRHYSDAKKHPSHHGLIIEDENNNKIGVFFTKGLGTSVSTILLEELIFLGGKCFITYGSAGCLKETLKIGQFVLVDKSIRGEGTSHYYQKKGLFSYPDIELNKHITDYFSLKNIDLPHILAWTTAALYRETPSLLESLIENKVDCIDMESSAMLAVAQHRNIPLSVLFYLSDQFHHQIWEPHFTDDELKTISNKMLLMVIDFLLNFKNEQVISTE